MMRLKKNAFTIQKCIRIKKPTQSEANGKKMEENELSRFPRLHSPFNQEQPKED